MVTFNLFRFLAAVLFAFGGIVIGIFVGAEIQVFAEEYGYVPGILILLPTWAYYCIGLALWLLAYRLHAADGNQRGV
jgi:membrane protein DedA with SNARE-associated domain